MRSRRPALVLLMAMVLLVSAISAAERDDGRRAGAPATTTAAPVPAQAPGPVREVAATLPSSMPVRARVGDTVVLRVRSATPDIARMLDLGLQTSVGPALPGELRFVADAPGTFPVTLQVAGTTGGLVQVRAADGT